uniref:hypothetical protein n=1 Tax=Bradyrhizobium sp. (strain ORS 278) TaxID=114615 RepID=UPI0012FEE37C|nr:hypothetical protein [Bradyrhizobium sp. ORS 278]
MPIHESPKRRTLQITPRRAMAAIILGAFLLLHAVAGIILRAAATGDGVSAVSMRQDYD